MSPFPSVPTSRPDRLRDRGCADRWRLGCAALAAAALLAACDSGKPQADAVPGGEGAAAAKSTEATGQVVARVNGEELTVHQVNAVLLRLGAGATERAALDLLIDQTLARQEALKAGLEREPAVMQQLETARRESLARAWADRLVADLSEPDESELRQHFEANPQLYAQRRSWQFQELWADLPTVDQADWQRRVTAAADLRAAQQALQRAGVRHAVAPVVRTSEQLPAAQRERLLQLKPGEPTVLEDPRGLRVWWLVSSQEQPVDWKQARPVIERLLLQQRRQERVSQALGGLRESARIERLEPAQGVGAGVVQERP